MQKFDENSFGSSFCFCFPDFSFSFHCLPSHRNALQKQIIAYRALRFVSFWVNCGAPSDSVCDATTIVMLSLLQSDYLPDCICRESADCDFIVPQSNFWLFFQTHLKMIGEQSRADSGWSRNYQDQNVWWYFCSIFQILPGQKVTFRVVNLLRSVQRIIFELIGKDSNNINSVWRELRQFSRKA